MRAHHRISGIRLIPGFPAWIGFLCSSLFFGFQAEAGTMMRQDPGQQHGPSIKDESRRQRYSLNERWEYLEEDLRDPGTLDQSLKQWEKVTLPHTWNVWDVVDPVPGYRRSGSWYRRELVVPEYRNDLRFVLSFEGVNIICDVFVNGLKAGSHVGGYVGFDIDITKLINKGGTNTLLVRASNEYDPNIIPSQKSDFCIYGGITRDVWLDVIPATYLSDLKIRTPKVGKGSAQVEVEVLIGNESGTAQQFEVECLLLDRRGWEVARGSVGQIVKEKQQTVALKLPEIRNPSLWSPADPALYSARVRLKSGGRVVDETSDRFGCRWFEFKERGPFFLNGERLLLRGTHRHEDYAGYGNALPDSLHRKDMQMIKEMGANFVRLAHYPQDPEVYRACDELGLLVWDELPWCRGGMGGEDWKNHTRRLLGEQISRYYNHPSIIIRSLGNEMYWLPDFPGGEHLDSLRAMVKELNDISHRLDPGRVTSTRKFTEGADLVDMVSPSIWPGWYSGFYKNYETALDASRAALPRFFHAEYGGDSHVGRHTENPVSGDATTTSDGWEENIKPQAVKNVANEGDWGESYIVDLFDWMLHVSEKLPWFTGNAQWAFKDFPTPLRPENPIPYMNQKGLVDRAGKPKDAYYVFKSYWTTSPLFCYIESHTWRERSGPEHAPRAVNVFSNCPEVELFLNGVWQGKRKRDIGSFPASGLSWEVRFTEGENTLTAVGLKDGKKVTEDTLTVRYWFTKHLLPDQIVLSTETLPGGNVLVTALAVDKNGRRCLDYNKRIYFTAEGKGELLVNYGTPTRSSVIEMANGKAQIEFVPHPAGSAVIEARNQDFKGAYIFINER